MNGASTEYSSFIYQEEGSTPPLYQEEGRSITALSENPFFITGDIFDKVHFRDLLLWLTALIDALYCIVASYIRKEYGDSISVIKILSAQVCTAHYTLAMWGGQPAVYFHLNE